MLGQVLKSLSNVKKCLEVEVDGLGSADLPKVGFTARFVELTTLNISLGHCHEEAGFQKFSP